MSEEFSISPSPLLNTLLKEMQSRLSNHPMLAIKYEKVEYFCGRFQLLFSGEYRLIKLEMSLLHNCTMHYCKCILIFIKDNLDKVKKDEVDFLNRWLSVLDNLGDVDSINNKFIFLKPVLENLINEDLPLWVKKEFILHINRIFEKPTQLIFKGKDKKFFFVVIATWMKLLITCGDYEFQTILVEAIISTCQLSDIEEILRDIFDEKNIWTTKFLEVYSRQNYVNDLKTLLIGINDTFGYVRSVPCLKVTLQETVIPPLKGMYPDTAWMHINYGFRTLSFNCHRDALRSLPASNSHSNSYEFVTVNFEDVDRICLLTNNNSKTIKSVGGMFLISLSGKCSCRFGSSKEIVSLIKKIIFTAPDGLHLQFLKEAFVKLFGKKFKEESNIPIKKRNVVDKRDSPSTSSTQNLSYQVKNRRGMKKCNDSTMGQEGFLKQNIKLENSLTLENKKCVLEETTDCFLNSTKSSKKKKVIDNKETRNSQPKFINNNKENEIVGSLSAKVDYQNKNSLGDSENSENCRLCTSPDTTTTEFINDKKTGSIISPHSTNKSLRGKKEKGRHGTTKKNLSLLKNLDIDILTTSKNKEIPESSRISPVLTTTKEPNIPSNYKVEEDNSLTILEENKSLLLDFINDELNSIPGLRSPLSLKNKSSKTKTSKTKKVKPTSNSGIVDSSSRDANSSVSKTISNARNDGLHFGVTHTKSSSKENQLNDSQKPKITYKCKKNSSLVTSNNPLKRLPKHHKQDREHKRMQKKESIDKSKPANRLSHSSETIESDLLCVNPKRSEARDRVDLKNKENEGIDYVENDYNLRNENKGRTRNVLNLKMPDSYALQNTEEIVNTKKSNRNKNSLSNARVRNTEVVNEKLIENEIVNEEESEYYSIEQNDVLPEGNKESNQMDNYYKTSALNLEKITENDDLLTLDNDTVNVAESEYYSFNSNISPIQDNSATPDLDIGNLTEKTKMFHPLKKLMLMNSEDINLRVEKKSDSKVNEIVNTKKSNRKKNSLSNARVGFYNNKNPIKIDHRYSLRNTEVVNEKLLENEIVNEEESEYYSIEQNDVLPEGKKESNQMDNYYKTSALNLEKITENDDLLTLDNDTVNVAESEYYSFNSNISPIQDNSATPDLDIENLKEKTKMFKSHPLKKLMLMNSEDINLRVEKKSDSKVNETLVTLDRNILGVEGNEYYSIITRDNTEDNDVILCQQESEYYMCNPDITSTENDEVTSGIHNSESLKLNFNPGSNDSFATPSMGNKNRRISKASSLKELSITNNSFNQKNTTEQSVENEERENFSNAPYYEESNQSKENSETPDLDIILGHNRNIISELNNSNENISEEMNINNVRLSAETVKINNWSFPSNIPEDITQFMSLHTTEEQMKNDDEISIISISSMEEIDSDASTEDMLDMQTHFLENQQIENKQYNVPKTDAGMKKMQIPEIIQDGLQIQNEGDDHLSSTELDDNATTETHSESVKNRVIKDKQIKNGSILQEKIKNNTQYDVVKTNTDMQNLQIIEMIDISEETIQAVNEKENDDLVIISSTISTEENILDTKLDNTATNVDVQFHIPKIIDIQEKIIQVVSEKQENKDDQVIIISTSSNEGNISGTELENVKSNNEASEHNSFAEEIEIAVKYDDVLKIDSDINKIQIHEINDTIINEHSADQASKYEITQKTKSDEDLYIKFASNESKSIPSSVEDISAPKEIYEVYEDHIELTAVPVLLNVIDDQEIDDQETAGTISNDVLDLNRTNIDVCLTDLLNKNEEILNKSSKGIEELDNSFKSMNSKSMEHISSNISCDERNALVVRNKINILSNIRIVPPLCSKINQSHDDDQLLEAKYVAISNDLQESKNEAARLRAELAHETQKLEELEPIQKKTPKLTHRNSELDKACGKKSVTCKKRKRQSKSKKNSKISNEKREKINSLQEFIESPCNRLPDNNFLLEKFLANENNNKSLQSQANPNENIIFEKSDEETNYFQKLEKPLKSLPTKKLLRNKFNASQSESTRSTPKTNISMESDFEMLIARNELNSPELELSSKETLFDELARKQKENVTPLIHELQKSQDDHEEFCPVLFNKSPLNQSALMKNKRKLSQDDEGFSLTSASQNAEKRRKLAEGQLSLKMHKPKEDNMFEKFILEKSTPGEELTQKTPKSKVCNFDMIEPENEELDQSREFVSIRKASVKSFAANKAATKKLTDVRSTPKTHKSKKVNEDLNLIQIFESIPNTPELHKSQPATGRKLLKENSLNKLEVINEDFGLKTNELNTNIEFDDIQMDNGGLFNLISKPHKLYKNSDKTVERLKVGRGIENKRNEVQRNAMDKIYGFDVMLSGLKSYLKTFKLPKERSKKRQKRRIIKMKFGSRKNSMTKEEREEFWKPLFNIGG